MKYKKMREDDLFLGQVIYDCCHPTGVGIIVFLNEKGFVVKWGDLGSLLIYHDKEDYRFFEVLE